MLRIGICDDESSSRDALRLQLEKILRADTEEVVYEFSSGTGAVRWLRNHPGEIDLLFLDVEMEGMSGIEAAQEFRTFDCNLVIVFVTGYPDYVFDGYRVRALDYLLKPTQEERLKEVLRRVRSTLYSSKEEQFTFQNTDGIYRLYRSEILYCFSERRKVTVVTKEKALSLYARLDEVQARLGKDFVRIHQRYLVNAGPVEHIASDSVVIGGKTLPISRALKAEAITLLAKAMLRGE